MTNTNKPRKDTKPLAAYRLGLFSRMFGFWRDNYLADPDPQMTMPEDVPKVLKELQKALAFLAREIPEKVYGQVFTFLRNQGRLWSAICEMVDGQNDGVRAWDDSLIKGAKKDEQPTLSELAAFAFETPSALTIWFKLGVAIGEYWVRVSQQEIAAPPPLLGPILTRCLSMPAEIISLHPVLQAVVSLAAESTSLSPKALLSKVLEMTWHVPGLSSLTARDDFIPLRALVEKLDAAIQEDLQDLAQVTPFESPGTVLDDRAIPRWDKETGELRLGDELVRKLASQTLHNSEDA